MGDPKVYPFGFGCQRCPMCNTSFFPWPWSAIRVTASTGTALRNRCSGCCHEWLTEPRDASPTRADLEDEIAQLRAQLAEKGGHRG